MKHSFGAVTNLSQQCTVCGRRVTIMAFMFKSELEDCPGYKGILSKSIDCTPPGPQVDDRRRR